jgi:hypothetical protein
LINKNLLEKERLMRIRDDPEQNGKILKRSICGDMEEFIKHKELKHQL